MNFEDGLDLLKLAELLKPPAEETVQEDDLPKTSYRIQRIINKNCDVSNVKSNDPKTIEEFEIQQENECTGTLSDCKKEPSYVIKYRQAVTPEDIFLQLGAKSPSTASCEDMILTIYLPGEIFTGLDLNVSNTKIQLTGCSHQLSLSLPSPINPDLSKANWNQDIESLILTLRMEREFDFVNF